jgi:hypothetical protein
VVNVDIVVWSVKVVRVVQVVKSGQCGYSGQMVNGKVVNQFV